MRAFYALLFSPMRSLSRSSKIIIAIVAVFIVGAGAVIIKNSAAIGGIPDEFKQARLQGALISEAIVADSNSLSGILESVNKLEKEGKFQDALKATDELVSKSQDVRGKAVDLSHQIETMAQALPKISSAEARQAALDSISDRLAVISRLVNYSNYIGDLLAALRDRFSPDAHSQTKIDSIISEINLEVVAINNFDKNASASMERFDKIVNGQ
jgi:hypothetical protein